MQNKQRQASRKKGWRTASTSDIHELYELSVQEPEAEVDFIDQVWKELRGRKASSIREDFCGTAIASMEWVKRRKTNFAWGVDLDPEVLDFRQQFDDRNPLDEIIREGARRMLQAAIDAEVNSFIQIQQLLAQRPIGTNLSENQTACLNGITPQSPLVLAHFSDLLSHELSQLFISGMP